MPKNNKSNSVKILNLARQFMTKSHELTADFVGQILLLNDIPIHVCGSEKTAGYISSLLNSCKSATNDELLQLRVSTALIAMVKSDSFSVFSNNNNNC